MTTEEVLNHHLTAFSEGNLEMVMEDYTEESVLEVPHGTLKGKVAISAAFADFFGGLFKPGTYEFTMDRVAIWGEVAYIVWHSKNRGAEVKMGSDTLLVQNGKIAVQTLAIYIVEEPIV